ncbi:MAG: phage holin family protein [Microbacteriaceae bacterium]
MTETPSRERRGLFRLIAELPRLVTDLVRAELESLKNEIVGKLKALGVGAGLLAAAALVLLYALAALIAAAVLGIAVALPAWAAALIVGGALLVIAVVLVLAGVASLRRGIPPAPTDTIASVKEDVATIRGTRKRRV